MNDIIPFAKNPSKTFTGMVYLPRVIITSSILDSELCKDNLKKNHFHF